MNEISLLELKNNNYYIRGAYRIKLIGTCCKCGSDFIYNTVKKFLSTRKNKINKKHFWDSCQKCWHIINTSEDPKWVKKNQQAQLITQNKPEQKRKNAEGVKKSYTKEKRLRASECLKNRWKNDEDFRTKALSNISWNQTNNDRYHNIIKKSLGTGGLKGIYNDIRYESALELSYIIYCEENNISIKRYDIPAINYLDENNINRVYIPDFIINSNTIVEIKGLGLYYEKNLIRNNLKLSALKKWTINNNYEMILILSNDKVLTKNYKKARKLHHENKEKNNN